MEAGLVGVGEPGAAGHGQDALRPVHADTEQLHWPGSEIPGVAGMGTVSSGSGHVTAYHTSLSHTHMHARIHTRNMDTHARTHTQTHIKTYKCTNTHARTCAPTRASTHARTHAHPHTASPPGPGIRQVSGDGIESRPEEHSIGQPNVEEEAPEGSEGAPLPLPPSASSHLHHTQRLREGWEGLHAQWLQSILGRTGEREEAGRREEGGRREKEEGGRGEGGGREGRKEEGGGRREGGKREEGGREEGGREEGGREERQDDEKGGREREKR